MKEKPHEDNYLYVLCRDSPDPLWACCDCKLQKYSLQDSFGIQQRNKDKYTQ